MRLAGNMKEGHPAEARRGATHPTLGTARRRRRQSERNVPCIRQQNRKRADALPPVAQSPSPPGSLCCAQTTIMRGTGTDYVREKERQAPTATHICAVAITSIIQSAVPFDLGSDRHPTSDIRHPTPKSAGSHHKSRGSFFLSHSLTRIRTRVRLQRNDRAHPRTRNAESGAPKAERGTRESMYGMSLGGRMSDVGCCAMCLYLYLYLYLPSSSCESSLLFSLSQFPVPRPPSWVLSSLRVLFFSLFLDRCNTVEQRAACTVDPHSRSRVLHTVLVDIQYTPCS